MLERYEQLQILRLIQADRPTNRQSMQMAALYAGQIVLASLLLMLGYKALWGTTGAALWAVVSAVLVVQPVIEQALAASAVRIAANTVGGIAGIIVGRCFGEGIWQVLLALVIAVFICERLRLDLGLRTACVSVAIIMMRSGGQVVSTGEERLAGVVIGCVTGLLVQILAETVRKKLGWRTDVSAPAASPSAGT